MADRHAAPSVRYVDLASLPDAVVDFVAALVPGEVLVVTQNGDRVATVTAAGGPLEGLVISGRNAEPQRAAARSDAVTVATAMKLSEAARASLSEELGADYLVLDMYAVPRTADVLLVPAISVHLLARLRAMFPAARLVVAELEDPELGVSYTGPVRRLLDAGADAYLAPVTVPALARQLERAVGRRRITAEPERSELDSAD